MSLFSCAFFFELSFLLALPLDDDDATVDDDATALDVADASTADDEDACCPLGLKLVSRFLDFESSLPVPRRALNNLSTDSCLVDFGDFVVSAKLGCGGGCVGIGCFTNSDVVFSSLNEDDFFKVELTSLLIAPVSSCARLLTTRSSGFGRRTEADNEKVDVGIGGDGGMNSKSSACSGPSSGIVG